MLLARAAESLYWAALSRARRRHRAHSSRAHEPHRRHADGRARDVGAPAGDHRRRADVHVALRARRRTVGHAVPRCRPRQPQQHRVGDRPGARKPADGARARPQRAVARRQRSVPLHRRQQRGRRRACVAPPFLGPCHLRMSALGRDHFGHHEPQRAARIHPSRHLHRTLRHDDTGDRRQRGDDRGAGRSCVARQRPVVERAAIGRGPADVPPLDARQRLRPDGGRVLVRRRAVPEVGGVLRRAGRAVVALVASSRRLWSSSVGCSARWPVLSTFIPSTSPGCALRSTTCSGPAPICMPRSPRSTSRSRPRDERRSALARRWLRNRSRAVGCAARPTDRRARRGINSCRCCGASISRNASNWRPASSPPRVRRSCCTSTEPIHERHRRSIRFRTASTRRRGKSSASGLEQRIRLSDAVVRDLYGPRRLLHDAVIPAEMVLGDPRYARACRVIKPLGPSVVLQTVDVVRDASGDSSPSVITSTSHPASATRCSTA